MDVREILGPLEWRRHSRCSPRDAPVVGCITTSPASKPKHAFQREKGRLGLRSTEARRMPVSVVGRIWLSRNGMLHEVPTCLTGPKKDGVRKVLPESSVNARRWLVEDKIHIGGSPKKRRQVSSQNIVGMGSRHRGGQGPQAPGGRYAGCARHGHRRLYRLATTGPVVPAPRTSPPRVGVRLSTMQ